MNPETASLIEVRRVRKHFTLSAGFIPRTVFRQRDRLVKAVDDVTLAIAPREVVGLVGESGCGKSTLGRVMANLVEPTEGELRYQGRKVTGGQVEPDSTRGDPLDYRQVAQVIFQNPYSSLNPRKTVREIIGVALRLRAVTGTTELTEEIVALMQQVGLSPRQLDAYPHQFSGGQRQRIGIARALAARPRFVVADEPVSALDVSVKAQVMNLLMDLREQYALTYLFIAHDLSAVEYMSDRVVVMYLGHIVEEAPTAKLFDSPTHPYTRALLAAVPVVDKTRRKTRIILEGNIPSPIDPPGGCPFKSRCYAPKVPECETTMPPVVQVAEDHRVTCWLAEGTVSNPVSVR